MEIILIVFINVLFLAGVYFTLSRRVSRVEERSLPQKLEDEMNSLITTCNNTTLQNIDLLDDRLGRLKTLTVRAEKQSEQLEGLVRRAEAMHKLRELMQPGALAVPGEIPDDAAAQAGEGSLKSQAISPAAAIQALAGRRGVAPRSAHEVTQAYKNTQNVTAPAARAAEKKDDAKKAAKKANSRRKKTPDEILRAMSEAGDDASEIARVLSISREEVLLKQRLLRSKK